MKLFVVIDEVGPVSFSRVSRHLLYFNLLLKYAK